FEFGKNWSRFLKVLDEERILQAEKSLKNMLPGSLEGKRFLDIGSGSGLFSLCARRLGANVHSFDFDPNSVKCAEYLRERFNLQSGWTVEQGSVLDKNYLNLLGKFDVVYSWGVLHHTGAMWEALGNAAERVADGGLLFISIYNDQGRRSIWWRRVKQVYCANFLGRMLITCTFIPFFVVRGAIFDLLRLKNPFSRYSEYRKERGMSIFHDYYDWLGGLPFEVATPEAIFDFFRARGFELRRLKTSLGLACNEFVFEKVK
ncbi:MAG TPA: class I SAM-dependent methyltransferase, partial [Planctomycetota bacterium]|nr:class I SAM-dependent methyltransferase [Planctomycetota bacterium]